MSNRDENNRRMGVQLAYHIVKDAGNYEDAVKALEVRLTRAEKTNVPVTVRDSDLREFESRVKNNVFTCILACTLSTLADKFGYGSEDMKLLVDEIEEKADTIYGGWLDWNELVEYLKDEYGFDLMVYVGESQEILDRIEEKLNKRTVFVGEKRVYQRRPL